MEESMELSVLINLLLRSVLDGVISSELENQQKIQEIKKSITLSSEEFAKRFITQQEIREQILFVFPSEQVDISNIDSGKEYKPQEEDVQEEPPIKKELGYQMMQGDYRKEQEKYYITQEGYNHLYQAMQDRYVQEKKVLIKQLLYKGVPNVYVDRGEITSKVYMNPKWLEKVVPGYEGGIIYKCYKEWTLDERYEEKNQPYKQGMCKHFDLGQLDFKDAKMIIFEGVMAIRESDYYRFKLCTLEQCVIELNYQTILTTANEEEKEYIGYIEQGMWPFKIKCSYRNEEDLIALYYTTCKNSKCQVVQAVDLYHQVNNAYSTIMDYRNKKVKVDVTLPKFQDQGDIGIGEIKLFYHLVHE